MATIDKTLRMGVDYSEVKKAQDEIRLGAEYTARDMIQRARQQSISAKEVLRDIKEQVRELEKQEALYVKIEKHKLDTLKNQGAYTASEYSERVMKLRGGALESETQIKYLRDIISAIEKSSKEEIRENRKNIENIISGDESVRKLGVKGDEFEALKRTVQYGILGDVGLSEEKQRRGFELSRGISGMTQMGGAIGSGNIMGMAGGVMSLISNPVALAAALVGGIAIAGTKSGINSTEQLRSYMMATQIGSRGAIDNRIGQGSIFSKLGLKAEEGMNLYGDMFRATGGGNLSGDTLLTLASMTRSRDISPQLLAQTMGFQRYGGSSGVSVVSDFERALERLYPADFKRKLVQLPEMMGIYNTLAQQMLQTVGSVDQGSLTSLVTALMGGGFEGEALQRKVSGMPRGFNKSGNDYIRMKQFNALRKMNPDIGYQESLEILESPFENFDYMRILEQDIRKGGLGEYRAWYETMGLSAKEARLDFESGDFSRILEKMAARDGETTKPSEKEILEKYYSDASNFQNEIKTKIDTINETLKNTLLQVSQYVNAAVSGDLPAVSGSTMFPLSPASGITYDFMRLFSKRR